MNSDVTALQTMPEITAGVPGLRPKRCTHKTTVCLWPTCRVSYVTVA